MNDIYSKFVEKLCKQGKNTQVRNYKTGRKGFIANFYLSTGEISVAIPRGRKMSYSRWNIKDVEVITMKGEVVLSLKQLTKEVA